MNLRHLTIEDRVDAFFHKLFVSDSNFDNFLAINICFYLTFGQADVEKGFNITMQYLVDNLQQFQG